MQEKFKVTTSTLRDLLKIYKKQGRGPRRVERKYSQIDFKKLWLSE